jgi:hypothetical protein
MEPQRLFWVHYDLNTESQGSSIYSSFVGIEFRVKYVIMMKSNQRRTHETHY